MDHGPCYRTHVRSPWSRSPADRFEVSINRVTSGTFVIAPLTGHFAIAVLSPDFQSFFHPPTGHSPKTAGDAKSQFKCGLTTALNPCFLLPYYLHVTPV
jgi:hypothetical protein